MSRKHFVEFAVAIAGIKSAKERGRMAEFIGSVCARCNGRFDWGRWYRACNVERS